MNLKLAVVAFCWVLSVGRLSAQDAAGAAPASGDAAQAPAPAAAPAAAALAEPAAAAPSEAPTPPPPPSAAEVPAPPPVGQCVPSCREGYTCHKGACVSACNPPCAADERCNALGECVNEKPQLFFDDAGTTTFAPDPTAENHDGFLLRFTLGFGGGVAQRDLGSTLKYSGGAVFLALDVGAVVAENFAVYGRLADFGLVNPKQQLGSADLGNTKNTTLSFGMFGAGASYFFMPINLYVGGAVGFAAGVVETPSNSDNSRLGFAFDLDVGKEWWIDDDWGLGVALRFSHADVPPQESAIAPGEHLRANAMGVLFSATYN